MKRFIDMGDQITGGVRTFAWWDTITDKFEMFRDCQAWETKESFMEDFNYEREMDSSGYRKPEGMGNLDRYLRLFPSDWKPRS